MHAYTHTYLHGYVWAHTHTPIVNLLSHMYMYTHTSIPMYYYTKSPWYHKRNTMQNHTLAKEEFQR